MKSKNSIGKLISFKLINSEKLICGLVVDYNEKWTLLKYNPVDYIIDGFLILNNKIIENHSYGSSEKFTEKLILLKGYKVKSKEIIPLKNIETILRYLNKKFELFQFSINSEEDICYLGNLESIEKEKANFNLIDTKGKWIKRKKKIDLNSITEIQFETDYINTLKLICK